MKSSSANIGAMEAAALFREMEKRARTGLEIGDILSRIEAMTNDLIGEINQEIVDSAKTADRL